jgi:hypothetical protein
MKARTCSRFVRPVALGLAVAAILAPGAQAQDQPYGELYQRDSVAPYGELYQRHSQSSTMAPGPGGPSVIETPAVAPAVQAPAPGPGGPSIVETPAVAPAAQAPAAYGELYQHPGAGLVTPTASGGIDWTDAGIGAGLALGVLLLPAAGALVVRRRGLAHS